MNPIYSDHRNKLFQQLPENSIALISSGSEAIRNRDVEYPFRAQSDFQYLTGFVEPDSVLILVKKSQNQSIVFLRSKDPEKEIWDGRRLGVESAPESLGVDASYAIDELDSQMPVLMEDCEHFWVSFSDLAEWTMPIQQWLDSLKKQVRRGVDCPSHISDLDQVLHELRLFKSDAEIGFMKTAAQISVQGHLKAMQAVLSSEYEYQVQAQMEAEFKNEGSPRVAFNSIVASGENACILHYTENDALIDKQALLLIDAGAEYKGYAGDITTTIPASGRFTEVQALLYSLVLKAQKAAIAEVMPGQSYDQMHQASVEVLTSGLIELGLLKGTLEEQIETEAYKEFFMHGTGHWLGMDVHDVGQYKVDGEWRAFEEGMVVTVEPGLYVSSEHEEIDPKWHNIGIRIEDDVLVTQTGHEVLTTGLPRTVEAIEQWMAKIN